MAVTETSGASFSFERVLTRTSGLVGRNFVPFFALSFVFTGLPYAAVQLLQPTLVASGDPVSVGLLAAGAAIISMATGLLLQGTLTRASVDELAGKKVSLGAALSVGLAVMLPLLGLGLLVGLGVMAGAVLLLVPGIMLAVRWSVAAPVLVAERKGILAAMGRSAVLTKGHRWSIFGLMVIIILFSIVVMAVFGAIVGGGAFAFADPAAGLEATAPWLVGMTSIIQAVISMVGTVLVCAIYFELRQIKEGVGIDEIASVFD